MQNEENQEYCIATIDETGSWVIYKSRNFKLSEIDILSLIKILIVERRSRQIGEKLLAVYEDSTEYRKQITLDRLKRIGIDKEDGKPYRTRNSKFK